MSKIPELGIGIIYFPGFENVIESNFDLINVIEIEPQTFWFKNKEKLDSFIFNREKLDYLALIEKPKLFHGVGYPVAGSLPQDFSHIHYLKLMQQELNPVWMSEHLSFNNFITNGKSNNTNFLLPPLQTKDGAETASKGIINYKSHFNIPFAFETGVNYLQPYSFEIDDGAFINKVAEMSQSKILLDIHNLLTNQRNGRQTVDEFIKQTDLSQVIQIHLAGGFNYNGYYLDSHSNVSSVEVFEIFEKIVKRLSNLKAITFEMLPEYLDFVPHKLITKQLEKMNSIWDRRGSKKVFKNKQKKRKTAKSKFIPTVKEWETTLGSMVLKKEEIEKRQLYYLLKQDKGINIIQDLIIKFRSSSLINSLKLSCRYIILKYGISALNEYFELFWKETEPFLFASDNGLAFARFLIKNTDRQNIEFIDLVTYEFNSLKTLQDNKRRKIEISFDPAKMVNSLMEGKMPEEYKQQKFQIIIEPLKENLLEEMNSVIHT